MDLQEEIKMRIPHSRPSIDEKDISSVNANLESRLIAYGNEVSLFEQEMSSYVGVRGGVATNSGTNALHLALKALNIKPGDEVIIPSYVCNSVLSAVKYTGAKPVLADIESKGYNIDPKSVAEKLSNNTKAVVVPHMFGTPAKLDELLELGISIIEDCAHAIGADYKKRKVGSFGISSICSFYATKVMTTGHGGMVLTDKKEILEKLKDMTTYDAREKYDVSYNYEMTDFQAALGRSQLKKLDSFIKRRRDIAKIYDDVFKRFEQLIPEVDGSIYFRYVLEVDYADDYVEAMRSHDVHCAKPVFKPLHQYFDDGNFTNTDRAATKAVSIPIYPSLTDDEIKYVTFAIDSVWPKMKTSKK
jgi:dTDP-4-amino-4,6-dideoxygalactose transaminase